MQSKTKVLIVEDEPTIAKEIAFNLEDHGFEIAGIAHSSEKALTLLKNRDIDIAMLDIAIQGNHNGIELAKIINENYKIPFLYLTSFADSDTISEAAETQPEGYLVKPFKDSDLKPAIEVALAKHKSKRRRIPSLEQINYLALEKVTKSEYKVIEKIFEGKINTEIASELFISINTVKKHANNIYRKIGVDRKPKLIKFLRDLMLD